MLIFTLQIFTLQSLSDRQRKSLPISYRAHTPPVSRQHHPAVCHSLHTNEELVLPGVERNCPSVSLLFCRKSTNGSCELLFHDTRERFCRNASTLTMTPKTSHEDFQNLEQFCCCCEVHFFNKHLKTPHLGSAATVSIHWSLS